MGMALAAIGTAITVVGQVRQANAQAAMYEHQAQVQEYNYKVRSAERDEQRKRVMANQRSSYAAQGVDPGSGSALDVYARSAGQFAAEDTQDKYSMNNQQGALRANASNAKSAGYMNAAGTIFNFAADAATTMGGSGGGDTSLAG